jgi:hypothetical protein
MITNGQETVYQFLETEGVAKNIKIAVTIMLILLKVNRDKGKAGNSKLVLHSATLFGLSLKLVSRKQLY